MLDLHGLTFWPLCRGTAQNFSGLSEDQLLALPQDVRNMVMAGATTVMAGGGGGPGAGGMMQMNGGPMMNQMMNMGPMMNPMMEMGMGDMAMMQDGGGGGPQGGGQGNPEGQVGMGMVGEGFGPGGGGGGQGMMGMGMNPEFAMQVSFIYPHVSVCLVRAAHPWRRILLPWANKCTLAWKRAVPLDLLRLLPLAQSHRDHSVGEVVRKEWVCVDAVLGSLVVDEVCGSLTCRSAHLRRFTRIHVGMPVRPASPLPPNVPTGPRNKNKYKDIDGSAPAVDGLDYGGGGGGGGGGGTGGGDRERSERSERGSDRKERGTPDVDERDRSSR